MAYGGDPSVTLQDEATCSICLDYFQDPVMVIDCGHNFCRACIVQYQGGGSDREASSRCPQCRISFLGANLRPNRHLGNMVEVIRQFRLQRLSEPEGAEQDKQQQKRGDWHQVAPKKVCEKHKESAKLFCQEDKEFICLVCRESRAHKAHAVLPIDEAVQDYRDQIQSFLTILKGEVDEIQKEKWCNQKEVEQMKRAIGCTRQCTFLEKEANTQLALLDANEETMKMIDEVAGDFSERCSLLTKLIREIEGKCQQSAFEFLQNIDDLLSRCEAEISGKPKADLKRKAESVAGKITLVQSKSNTVSVPRCPIPSVAPQPWNPFLAIETQPSYPVPPEPSYPGSQVWCPNQIFESLTFDPETAHPRLVVSKSGKSVRWGDDFQIDLFPCAKRFEQSRCVLSWQRFSSGQHDWLVEVTDKGPWAIGVAIESVWRKGPVHLQPTKGIWAMTFNNDLYWFYPSHKFSLAPSFGPRVIHVSFHYQQGTVTFKDLETQASLGGFFNQCFCGERVHAFFRVGGPSSPLRLCSVAHVKTHFPSALY